MTTTQALNISEIADSGELMRLLRGVADRFPIKAADWWFYGEVGKGHGIMMVYYRQADGSIHQYWRGSK